MNTLRKRSKLRFLFDSLLIVLSVLLALFLNEWRSNYKENKKTAILLENLMDEISANRDFINEVLPYHQSIFKRLTEIERADSVELKLFPDERLELSTIAPKGIIQGRLTDIAWTVAKQDKITNRINPDKSKALYIVYDQQEIVKKTIDRIVSLITSREMHRKELLHESIFILKIQLNELIAQEKYLVDKYKHTSVLMNL